MKDKEFHFGLIGWPLDYSISPSIQNAALSECGFSGDYLLYPIPRLPNGNEQMCALLAQVRSGDLHGLNVTIPHKQSIIPYLDELTDTAGIIGAVNMIFRQDDRLIGDNGDAPAFRMDLLRFLDIAGRHQPVVFPNRHEYSLVESDGIPATALVLGAGGAARAVVYTLLQEGWHIIVASRRLTAAMKLVTEFEGQFTRRTQQLRSIPMDRENLSRITNCHLIVNATPVGTISGEETSPWPFDLPLPAGIVIYDLVYNPPETLLVRIARNAGLVATTGLGMLVEQAAMAFERWTQVPAPRLVMHSAARRSLGLFED
jgi:shikimate dehydrogenase